MLSTVEDIKNSFLNKDLFDHALTHRSWVNEHKGIRTSNERLEFLGDAILEFIVSREIFNLFPAKEEGFLTALRASLVNTVSLAEFAKKIDLGKYLYLSKGEEETRGRSSQSLLADTVEALIGAIFIDRGLSACEDFILKNILCDVQEKASKPLKDPKSMLQEYVQSRGFPAPKYRVMGEVGPDHDKQFTISVFVNDEEWGSGKGKSKSYAEQLAAKDALNRQGL